MPGNTNANNGPSPELSALVGFYQGIINGRGLTQYTAYAQQVGLIPNLRNAIFIVEGRLRG